MQKREFRGGVCKFLSQRIVFLPCGQFHGWSIVPICRTMLVICEVFSTRPTMTLLRHASIANSLRVLDGRLDEATRVSGAHLASRGTQRTHSMPEPVWSLSRNSSSSRSVRCKCQNERPRPNGITGCTYHRS